MARMEFLDNNILDTTTMIVASTGTGTFSYAYDRNDSLAYSTVGYTTNTSTIISVEFLGPTVISNLILKNHNLKNFRAFYNSATANTFSVDINKTTNSATSSYFLFASLTVNSIQIQMDSAITNDTERKIGELIVSERRLQFAVNPSHGQYEPVHNITRIIHTMPDGGKTAFNIKRKFKAKIGLEYIEQSFRNSLETVYSSGLPLYFLAFPTTGTDWDNQANEIIWTNSFNFSHDDNSKTQGYSGDIVIEETPGA